MLSLKMSLYSNLIMTSSIETKKYRYSQPALQP